MKKILKFVILIIIVLCSWFYIESIRKPSIEDLPFQHYTIKNLTNNLKQKYDLESIIVYEQYESIDTDFIYEDRMYSFVVNDETYECIITNKLSKHLDGQFYIQSTIYDNYGMNYALKLIDDYSSINYKFNLIKNDFKYYDQIMLEFNDFQDYKDKVLRIQDFYNYIETKVNYPITIKFVHELIPLELNNLIVSNIDTEVNGFKTVNIDLAIDQFTTYLLEHGSYFLDEFTLSNGEYSMSYNLDKANPSLFISSDDYYYNNKVLNLLPMNLYYVFEAFDLDLEGDLNDFKVEDKYGNQHNFIMSEGNYPFSFNDEYITLYNLEQYDHNYSSTVKNATLQYFINDELVLAGVHKVTAEYLFEVFNIAYFQLKDNQIEDEDINSFFDYIKEEDLSFFESLMN